MNYAFADTSFPPPHHHKKNPLSVSQDLTVGEVREGNFFPPGGLPHLGRWLGWLPYFLSLGLIFILRPRVEGEGEEEFFHLGSVCIREWGVRWLFKRGGGEKGYFFVIPHPSSVGEGCAVLRGCLVGWACTYADLSPEFRGDKRGLSLKESARGINLPYKNAGK